jgi:hypothetical protein
MSTIAKRKIHILINIKFIVMQKAIAFFTLALIFISNLNAQEVISSAGDTKSAGGYEVSWTLGESVIETLKGTNNTLTQGFHQTNLNVTALDDLILPGLELSVYPNPVNYVLNLKATGREDIKLKYRLYGIDGRLLFHKKIVNNPEEINMHPYAEGSYLLKVTTIKDDPVQTFKVVKR